MQVIDQELAQVIELNINNIPNDAMDEELNNAPIVHAQIRAQNQNPSPAQSPNPLYCTACSQEYVNHRSLKNHQKTQKHAKNLQKLLHTNQNR